METIIGLSVILAVSILWILSDTIAYKLNKLSKGKSFSIKETSWNK